MQPGRASFHKGRALPPTRNPLWLEPQPWRGWPEMSLKGQGPASLQLPGEQVGPSGLLDVLLWMLWQQLLCSIYNLQISETLHKQADSPAQFPSQAWNYRGTVSCVPGTAVSVSSFLVGELERPPLPTIGHGLKPSSVICQSHALVGGGSGHIGLAWEVTDPACC